MQLRHVGIVCKDIEASLQFYIEWFDCIIAREMLESGDFISTILGMQNSAIRTIKLKLSEGKSQIELLSFQNVQQERTSSNLYTNGLTHFAIQVKNIDTLYTKMLRKGVEFVSSPQLSQDGIAKVCFCRDPNDVFIELVEIIEK